MSVQKAVEAEPLAADKKRVLMQGALPGCYGIVSCKNP